jgi:hypothetical protein
MRVIRNGLVALGLAVSSLVLAGWSSLPTATATAAAPTSATPTVVATGLLNPRGLAFTPNGTLYVAEAGSGGSTAFGDLFVGLTSRISAVNVGGSLPGTVTPVVTGFISGSPNRDGASALGIDGLGTQGGRILATVAEHHQLVDGSPPSPLVNAAEAQLGRLIAANPGGQWKSLADVGGSDYNYTQACIDLLPVRPPCGPDGQANGGPGEFPDSNPYMILAMPGRTYVADAGANTLDVVQANGSIQILAYVHAQANDFLGDEVPTCVAMAGGRLYVGSLNGNVFRYDGTSNLQLVALSGQLPGSIGGCTGDASGNLYVTAQFGGGVYKIAPDGSTTALAAVPSPSGIVMGPDGYLYVSQNSTSTDGQVVRLLP